MYEFWRQPALPIGIVLLILGVGNWMVSRDKLSEFEHGAHGPAPAEHNQSLEEFPQLTPRTNAMLLARLHRRLDEFGADDTRRDFYAVLLRGGRLIALAGLLLAGIGLLQVWRERRVQRAVTPPPVPPPSSATRA